MINTVKEKLKYVCLGGKERQTTAALLFSLLESRTHHLFRMCVLIILLKQLPSQSNVRRLVEHSNEVPGTCRMTDKGSTVSYNIQRLNIKRPCWK